MPSTKQCKFDLALMDQCHFDSLKTEAEQEPYMKLLGKQAAIQENTAESKAIKARAAREPRSSVFTALHKKRLDKMMMNAANKARARFRKRQEAFAQVDEIIRRAQAMVDQPMVDNVVVD